MSSCQCILDSESFPFSDGAPMSQHESREFQTEREDWFPVPFDGLEKGLVEVSAVDDPEHLANGPGRKLEEIFAELGIPYREGCGCRLFARQMDVWGVDGCRTRFDAIVTRLRKSAGRYSFRDRLTAGRRALRSGFVFSLNLLDPFPGLVAEAIRRSEAEQLQSAPICRRESSERGVAARASQ